MAHLVLVDDDDDIHALVGTFLRSIGHQVTSLLDGAQLEGLLAGGGIDLVLVDLNMPGIKGSDLIREMKQKGSTPKVLLYSAADESQLRQLARGAGADGYVQKGIEMPMLELRLKRYLRK